MTSRRARIGLESEVVAVQHPERISRFLCLAAGLAALACSSGCGLRGSPSAKEPSPSTATSESDWLSGARRAIALREYHASGTERGLQAPNRRHRLRTYFQSDGVRIFDRLAERDGPLVGLSLSGLGRDGDLRMVGPAVISHDGPRVDLARAEGLVEWYVNAPEGLEQGFTLATRPQGNGPLVLEVEVDRAAVALIEEVLEITSQNGRRLRFSDLRSWDADGRSLASRFAASEAGYRIVVDDQVARYPIVIDPLLTQAHDHAIQANVPFSNLGVSVASAGDVNADGYADVIVGASFYDEGQNDEGAAFVFHGGPGGVGDSAAIDADAMIESDQADAFLGERVASAGDVNGDGYDDVIVGSYLYDLTASGNEGAAWIFHGGPEGIAGGNPSTADTRLEGDQLSGFFGWDVEGAGDVNGDGYADVIVGAYLYDAPESNEGAAFVFHGSASGVPNGGPATADAQLESDQENAQLGFSVASAGDVDGDGYDEVIVGSVLYDDAVTDEGAAFVFHGGPSGIGDGSPLDAGLAFFCGDPNARCGEAVSSAGDLDGDGYGDTAIGAPSLDLDGFTNSGAVFIHYGSAGGLVERPGSFVQSPLVSGFFYGRSVAGRGDLNGDGFGDLIVGAPEASFGETSEGAVYVYLGRAGGLASQEISSFTLESDQAFANLGASAACAGDVDGDGFDDVIAGAPFFADGESGEGHAFLYSGGGTGIDSIPPMIPDARLESNQANAALGFRVAAAGDVNGDGFGDVLVGASAFDGGQTDEGAVFVFLGSAVGILNGSPASAHARLESDQASAALGSSVSAAGDVNGDGYGDIVVGAPFFDAGENDEGVAFVFLGSATGIADGNPGTADAWLESDQPGAELGASVSTAGDVNGDGYADVVVGARRFSAGETEEGAAFVFLGGPAGIADGDPTTAHARLESDQDHAQLGRSVAGAGDVNGDGYGDVLVGAPFFDAGENNEGAAFVFLGSAAGIANGDPGTADAQLESDQPSGLLGTSVAVAGDVNGDGFSDVVVGAPGFDGPESDEGAAFVFLGSASGIGAGNPATAHVRLEPDQADAELGTSVASAGDVNGDGFSDVVVGAPGWSGGESSEGAAFVFAGSAAGIPAGDPGAAHARLERNQGSAFLGTSVASAGDVNGDGFGDLVVGAPSFTAGQSNEGAAFLFQGNGEGRPLLVSQLRGDGSGVRVQPGGVSYDADGFQAGMIVTSPRGRERAALEFEVCPPGTPFGDASCTSRTSSWVDLLGLGGAEVVETISGLAPSAPYRWRARALYVPLHATEPGIVPVPRAGPWRRIAGGESSGVDLRLPEPSGAAVLLLGAAGVVALSRLRRSGVASHQAVAHDSPINRARATPASAGPDRGAPRRRVRGPERARW